MGNKNKHRPATKPTQVKKVSKETGVAPEDLNRLPQDAIQKIDDLTPDEDAELGDILGNTTSETADVGNDSGSGTQDGELDQELPIPESIPNQNGNSDSEDGESNVPETPETSEKKLIGHHPVTKDPIYI